MPLRLGSDCARALTAWGIVCLLSLSATSSSGASFKWLSVKSARSSGTVCIAVGEEEFSYHRLDDRSPLEFTATGPRRVKIITRYLYGGKDPDRVGYTVRIVRDGVMHLEKAISAQKSDSSRLCGGAGSAAGKIRRIYLDVPKGRHAYQVFVVEKDRSVGARVFRRVEVRESGTVSLTPSAYGQVCTLQFASGKLSKYYGFGEEKPLRFDVVGPTTIKVCTRLDFHHSMNGSQSYGLEVFQDAERLKGYQYHVRKMETVSYLERPDVLPGEMKCFQIRVPKGRHAYEIQFAGGSEKSGAAKIYIPQADLGRKG